MSIIVEREMLKPATGTNTAVVISQAYLEHSGLRRKETRAYESQSDTCDFIEYRISKDNGKTWGEWVRDAKSGKRIVGEDAIEDYGYSPAQNIWNPVHGHYVSVTMQMLFVGGYEKAYAARWRGERQIMWHSFLHVKDEAGEEISAKLVTFEEGADFDEETYHDTDYLTRNLGMTTDLIVLKNGDILFPMTPPTDVCCRLAGLDIQKVFPSVPYMENSGLICRGTWNPETRTYDLSFSEPIVLDDRVSSRGIDEPMLAELDSGKILLTFRVSNVRPDGWNCRISPFLPGYQYFSLSDDGGKTFAPPMPWYFDSREVVYSSCTYSTFIRSEKNGKLYWIGNITDPTKTYGNYPRTPLNIVEVNEDWGCAKKDTLTIIDDRREGEAEQVQLSNFAVLQDRETGHLEVYLAKLGQYDDRNVYDCESWKYVITLPE